MASTADSAIAVVGVGAILPDASDARSYWENIKNKRYSITEVPPERWSIADYYDPDPAAPDRSYSKIGGWVRGFSFDWKRFRIPPKVAAAMDEGQQWAVTIAAQTLADAGYPQRPLDTENTAVILGTAMGGELHYITHLRISFPEFARALDSVAEFGQLPADVRATIKRRWYEQIDRTYPPITEDTMPGELPNIVSGRVANVLNLRGPNFVTDAACASSFAAINAAMELLAEQRVDAVIAGGVDRNMGASTFIKFCKIGALSATGSRPFGEGADGFVMGEGSAAFLLKRLADAERDGDKIYAVIRGVGASSDGKGKGITAPNPLGQVLAVRRAWENAGLDPATCTLVEAHGTSTKVGDVVEVESLTQIFGGAPRHSIALGSAKSNIGHLKAGAGAAGFLKAVLAVHNKVLPPTLNAKRPNPSIDFPNTPFFINQELQEWPVPNGHPRRAGVSAYGFGGTNFHLVLEEHMPGELTRAQKVHASAGVPGNGDKITRPQVSWDLSPGHPSKLPLRGILALGADMPTALNDELQVAYGRVEGGWVPPHQAPDQAALNAPERLFVDFQDAADLLEKLARARKAAAFDTPQAWSALQAQGIFRGSGPAPGKIAFLFPGQGSQYVNMGRQLAEVEPVVAQTFADADQVMTPILGHPLTDYIFVDANDPDAMKAAEMALMQTAITQPAMLTMDTAIYKLLGEFGFQPDMVMGHSLGEYGALIAAGIMPFAHALEASAARGSEMTKVSMDDNGWMAAVFAPHQVIEETLNEIDGYVVAANINSYNQCVIGGASRAVEQAIEVFTRRGYRAQRIPVSHAFHTSIVAPASKPLRQVLDRLSIDLPKLPLVANVTGELYPATVEEIKDILEQQIAAPVQWVKGLETLYREGCRTFVEVGPKKALKGFVDDVLARHEDVVSLLTNHPKQGELPTFNQALCGLYAAGHGAREEEAVEVRGSEGQRSEMGKPSFSVGGTPVSVGEAATVPVAPAAPSEAIGRAVAQVLEVLSTTAAQSGTRAVQYDRNDPPLGSVVISGTGLGLPGAEKPVMDPDNALRILRGEQFVDLIPERFRRRMLEKRITRLVKSSDGGGSFQTITDPDEVIKLAGRPGSFDLEAEYGVPAKLVEALDTTTQLAMAAGLDALREAGIPLVLTWRCTTTGKYLPDRWQLPEALRDETGVIFASAFPGADQLADELNRYYTWESRRSMLAALEDLRQYTNDDAVLAEINRRIGQQRDLLQREPYEFDRRFIFRILAMGHSQFAEYIGARGPNTHVNAACAATAQGVAIAEDWIRSGRCRRVIVIAGDNVTGEALLEWIGAGFLALGAAATDNRVDEAALPFDRRRHGTILGMGACSLVVESEDAVRERGMQGIVELLSSETANSAYHGSRLDVDHISLVMENVVAAAERRFGVNRYGMASQLVFMSHETFTPARGGSASAEVLALRNTFGEAANDIVVANTKGFTGHPMGVGVEDVIAVKILEHGVVPPVPNFKEVDPDLGFLNLSRGGRYGVTYALHLAAGFGSQISLTLTRRIPGSPDRFADRLRYQHWLDGISGYDRAQTEVVKRVLRVASQGRPGRSPIPSNWRYGTGPTIRALAPGDGRAFAPQSIPVTAMIEGGSRAKPSMPPSRSEPEAAPAPPVEPGTPAPPVPVPEPSTEPELTHPPVPEPAPDPFAVAPSEPMTSPADVSASEAISGRVLSIVADKTGYPPDMLDLDLDLEADLGIDTVKQAETFAAIRETFDIPAEEGLSLRDYPTLDSVIKFVQDNRPDLVGDLGPAPQDQGPAVPTPAAPAGAETVTGSPVPAFSEDAITAQILAIVADKTGYPKDMLDLDLDLEADLGIDTVKQAETFAAVRDTYEIPPRDDLSLRDYPTLADVIRFVRESRPDLQGEDEPVLEAEGLATAGPVPAEVPSSPSVLAPGGDAVTAQILAIVAEKTGYPEDMLELDLDLEADLGIDTVKQAETFAAIRETYDIPAQEDLSLRDYPTLQRVVEFVYDQRPGLRTSAEGTGAVAAPAASAAPAEPIPGTTARAVVQSIGTLEDADRLPRRVPVPCLRPPLAFCKPTGVTLEENSRVVVMLDQGGVGKSLCARLQKRGVTVLVLDPRIATEVLQAQLREWLEGGSIQGVYWLPALDVEPDLEDMTLDSWREHNRVRVKNLYTAMRSLYHVVAGPNTFLVSATRLGGLHGYGREGATAPLGGAVVGFSKAYHIEQGMRENGRGLLVKVVDFEVSRKTAKLADLLIAETLHDPGTVEVGYYRNQRWAVTLREKPARDGQPGLVLNRETVFVVTGAAGGITSAIVTDLAVASQGVFYLLDLVAVPPRDDEDIQLFRKDREALKRKLIDEARARDERPTPVIIDQQLLAIERSEAALRAIESVEAAGGTAHYHAVNLLDGDAVNDVIARIRQDHGRIDVLLHAGGLLIDRTLPDKEPNQFDLVFDVKANGFFSLLKAAQGLPIAATVSFSSVAGRFGNNGQSDYSAANDLLCKVTSSMRRWRPETRAIAIDWTAWGEIGMASRGSVPKIMEALGIDMLPPEAGVPTIRRELTYGGTRGEVVVAGRLGAWTEERDPTGGLDVDKLNMALAQRSPVPLMIGEVKAARLYGGIEVETTLDPQEQPFLYDHAPDDGTPWLPGVMATEALAELAKVLAPGYEVVAVQDEEMVGAFKFFRMEPRTLYLSATVTPDGHDMVAHAVLRSLTKPPREGLPIQEREHFLADVQLSLQPFEQSTIAFQVPALDSLPTTAEEIYEVFFHGLAYQVIERAKVEGDTVVALMARSLPPNTHPANALSLVAPRLVELCFQSAALWHVQTNETMALPLGFRSLTTYPGHEASGRLYCLCRTEDDGKSFDAQVVDETGVVLVHLEGYRTVSRPGADL